VREGARVIRVKICGIQDEASALAAAEAGANAIGLIFAESRRRIEPARARAICAALPPFISRGAVVVNELHGDETPELCAQVGTLGTKVIRAVRVAGPLNLVHLRAYPVSALLLDTHRSGLRGGTGETFDWQHARPAAAAMPIILSGGLAPCNVAAAIAAVRPYAVDVSSGVETNGKKDHAKIRAFVAEARAADAAVRGDSPPPAAGLHGNARREVRT
jgi:phosphoribosylanthranilate isomerase